MESIRKHYIFILIFLCMFIMLVDFFKAAKGIGTNETSINGENSIIVNNYLDERKSYERLCEVTGVVYPRTKNYFFSDPYMFFLYDVGSMNYSGRIFAVNIYTDEYTSIGPRYKERIHSFGVENKNGVRTIIYSASTTGPEIGCAVEFYYDGEMKFGEAKTVWIGHPDYPVGSKEAREIAGER